LKKKSVVLFITLSFLIVMMALLSSILAIYHNYSKTNENVYNQTDVLIRNITKDLSTLDVNSSDAVRTLLIQIPFSSNDGDYRGIIDIKPMFKKINLNEYLTNKKLNKTIDIFLNNILEKYEVADPMFFKDLLLDSLDSDEEEREGYSEIILNDNNFKNGTLTFTSFNKILKYYAKKRQDKNIFKIPWKKFIFFSKQNTPLICDFVDKNLTKLLGVEEDNLCDAIKSDKFKEKLKNLDIIPFNKKRSFWVKIDTNFTLENSNNNFELIYDLTKKKVISIESHPIY